MQLVSACKDASSPLAAKKEKNDVELETKLKDDAPVGGKNHLLCEHGPSLFGHHAPRMPCIFHSIPFALPTVG